MTETAILKTALEGLQADRTESRTMMQYARELQEIWDNALMDAARNNRGTVEAESRQQASPRKKYWRPDLTENEWRLLERRMGEKIGSRENFLDEATKWVYANEKGVQVFALYGIGDGTDATPLYAVGGEKAAAAAADMQKFVNGGYHYDKGTGTALSRIRGFLRTQGDGGGDIRETSRGGSAGTDDALYGGERKGNAGKSAERGSEDQRGVKEKFSMREPVEETRDLLALHNMTPDNLPAELRIGLEKQGATVREYKAGDEQSRLEAVNADERVRFSVRESFSKEIDSWARDGMPEGVRFTLGSTGPVLQGLGAIESDIYMEGDKIKKILQDHPEMTLAEIKKVPQILEDPALILKSEGRGKSGANSRLVCFGLTKAQNGQPVMTVMDLRPRENGFVVDDMQKVNSAYTKKNPMAFIQKSDVVYADKKRAIPLLRTTGLTISSQRLLRNGYIGSISYKGSSVNIEGVPFSSVVKIEMEDKAQNQQREPRLSDRDVLRMAADMAQRDRSQRWSEADLNRFDLLQRKLLQLDEANAELEALKEERKVLLAGRKVKELTRDEQFDLAQNRNRTETQKGKMFVNRIQRVARNNIS